VLCWPLVCISRLFTIHLGLEAKFLRINIYSMRQAINLHRVLIFWMSFQMCNDFCEIWHTSLCVPHTSLCVPHTNLCVPHTSLCVPRTSLCVPHTNLCVPHTSLCVAHTSLCVPHTSLCAMCAAWRSWHTSLGASQFWGTKKWWCFCRL